MPPRQNELTDLWCIEIGERGKHRLTYRRRFLRRN